MRDLLTTLLEVAGMALVAVGAALIFFPAGVIVAGVGLIAVGYMAAEDEA